MAVLYRKYRPQTFGEVVGQQHIVKTLQAAVKNGSVAHAYLFAGSRGVGKTSVARILAKAVNCQGSEKRKAKSLPAGKAGEKLKGEACGQCEICKQVEQGRFLDLVEIDAASNTGVDNVRELIEHVKFQPSLGEFKVFIIDEVHMLSRGAFNALLKTLEEPPLHAIFILATTEPHKVPLTIISRTQRFDFLRLTEAEILKQLEYVAKRENLDLPEETLSLIAQNAQGGMRDALSLLDKVLTLGKKASPQEAARLLGITSLAFSQTLLGLIVEKKSRELPKFVEQLMQDGADFAVFNKDFLEYLRKLLVVKLGLPEADLGLAGAALKTFQTQIKLIALAELMFIVRLFLRAYKELPDSPSPELPLLLAAVEGSLWGQAASSDVLRPQAPKPAAANGFENGQNSLNRPEHQPAAAAKAEVNLDQASLEEIQAAWPQIVASVRAVNSPLATLLKNSPISEVEEGVVTIGVRYLFHKENLESLKNHSLITQAIRQASGKNLGFAAKVSKSAANEAVASETLGVLSGVLQVFGGEVVD